ncbi:hypothetical protein O5D80_004495 [Batrachochytrium dendrobatidis]|nr:hypothetical protein O5D80_004495 [Batrachochytrium dendrobatidis]
MKFTHISAFTIAALATSVHAILPQPSETIESVDPSPSPSLNSQSFPQATGGPEFPSTSTTQGPGGSQGGRSNQTPGARIKSYNLGGLLRGIGKKHRLGRQKTKSQYERGGKIDSLLMAITNIPEFSQSGYQGGAHGSTYLVKKNSRQHQRAAEAILKGMGSGPNLQETNFRAELALFWSYLGSYERWIYDILSLVNRFTPDSQLASEFVDDLREILDKLMEIFKLLRVEIYEEILGLNRNPSLIGEVIEDILSLVTQFMSRQTDLQELLERLFSHHSRGDWYNTNLKPELDSWLQKFKTSMQRYNA